MARKRTLRICALNVAMHPHSPEQYVDLLKKARSARIAAKFYGNRWGRFGTVRKKDAVYCGQLHLYTDFDPSLPWINLAAGKAAEAEELAAVRIPPDFKPEFTEIPYVFLPDCHRLVFAANHLSPKSALNLVRRILQNKHVRDPDSEVHVNLVQSQSTLDELYAQPKLLSVEVLVDRPNPDQLESLAHKLQDRLKKMNGTRLTEKVQSEFGKVLKPDNELRELGSVAMTNGRVDIAFKNEEGITEHTSSEETPKTVAVRYDPDSKTELDVVFSNTDLFRDFPE